MAKQFLAGTCLRNIRPYVLPESLFPLCLQYKLLLFPVRNHIGATSIDQLEHRNVCRVILSDCTVIANAVRCNTSSDMRTGCFFVEAGHACWPAGVGVCGNSVR